jgi:LPS export ABC transporter protein LptC
MNKSFGHKIVLKAAFITGCFFVFSCENDPKEIGNFNTKMSMVEEAVDIQSLLSQNGNPRALLKAPYMLRYSADTAFLEFPKKLHVNFFDSAGKVESQVDALYGKYFETRSKVYLRDSVVAFNVKGDTLRSPDLWWDQNTQKFYTDKNVRVRQKDKMIYGKGLEANQDLSQLTIFFPTGIVSIPDSVR